MKEKYFIISPCFNEGKGIATFLREIETKLIVTNQIFTIIIVDDASNDNTIEILQKFKFSSQNFNLKVIRLNFNMGHQEAIRVGLNYANKICDKHIKGIIVMDSDGEDDPDAIKELIKINIFDIVYVTRGKRQEGITFKIGYFFYKLLFSLIVGRTISFGNYSLISTAVLKSIHNQSFLHYAAFLSKQKFDIQKIRFDRQNRIAGKSKMSYKNLIFHGLLSMIEYSEEILFFLIKFLFTIFLFLIILGFYILYAKFISHNAVIGWASSLGSNLIISSLIIISTFIIGLLLLSIKKSLIQNTNLYEEIR